MLGSVPAFAQSVSGELRVVTDEGTRYMAFSADVYSSGRASGDLKFEGPLAVSDQDVDGDGSGDKIGKATSVSLAVSVDCGRVEGTRAVIAGTVKDSNIEAYLGRRVLLTVEDGVDEKTRDAYTWGLYRATTATWVASDAELDPDKGVGMTWIATDAEREDDKGVVASTQPVPVDCQTFSLASYTLEELPADGVSIQIKQ
jgi:hypothetical protein